MRRSVLYPIILSSVFVLSLISCGEDSSVTPSHDMSGTWTVRLSPTEEHMAQDPAVQASVVEQVMLQQSGAFVSGSSDVFSFEGSYKSLDTVVFRVFQNDHVGTQEEVASFTVTLSSANAFAGNGYLYEGESVKGANTASLENHFLVDGTRDLVDNTQAALSRSISSYICEIEHELTSYAISAITDNLFRPMGGKTCLLQKDGAGYWGFGKLGPGSVLPVWTQTLYIPSQWAPCTVRKYDFEVINKGTIRTLADLHFVTSDAERFFKHIGITSVTDGLEKIEDFYRKWGDFAISIGYSTHSGDAAIYVSTNSDHSEILEHDIVNHVYDGLKAIGISKVYKYAGSKIKTDWHLRRDPTGACSSKLFMIYLFGTAEVEYNEY